MKLWCVVAVALCGCAHAPTVIKEDPRDEEVVRLHRFLSDHLDTTEGDNALYELAETLRQANLPFTAFIYFTPIVQAGPKNAFHLQAVEALAELQRRLRDDVLIPSTFNNFYDRNADAWSALPAETLAAIHLQLGRLAHRKNKLTEARAFLEAVPANSAFFSRAQYLLALTLTDAGTTGLDEKTADFALSVMEQQHQLAELARINYATGRFDEALRWYRQVPLFSDEWNRALFESTNIETSACLFVRSNASLPEFEKRYVPLAESLNARTVVPPETNRLAYIELITDERSNALPAPVLTWLRSQERVNDTVALLAEVRAEHRIIESRKVLKNSRFAPEVLTYLAQNDTVLELVSASTIRMTLQDAARAIVAFDEAVKKVQSGELTCR